MARSVEADHAAGASHARLHATAWPIDRRISVLGLLHDASTSGGCAQLQRNTAPQLMALSLGGCFASCSSGSIQNDVAGGTMSAELVAQRKH
jgi:hypothetical protein